MPQPGSLLRGTCVGFEMRTSTAWVQGDTKSKITRLPHRGSSATGACVLPSTPWSPRRDHPWQGHNLRGALSRKMAPSAVSSSSSPSPRDREVGPEPCGYQGWVLTTELAFKDRLCPSAILLTSPRSGVKQLWMKQ